MQSVKQSITVLKLISLQTNSVCVCDCDASVMDAHVCVVNEALSQQSSTFPQMGAIFFSDKISRFPVCCCHASCGVNLLI